MTCASAARRPTKASPRGCGGRKRGLKQEPDFFGEQELVLIYIAKKLKEALRLEKVLTDAGVDYLVEPDKYSGGIIFRSERIGAFFYVAEAGERIARELMQRSGFVPYDTGE
jgi:hypothetical protein